MAITKGYRVEDLQIKNRRIPTNLQMSLIRRHLTNKGLTLDDVVELYKDKKIPLSQIKETIGLSDHWLYVLLSNKKVPRRVNRTLSHRGGKITKTELARREAKSKYLLNGGPTAGTTSTVSTFETLSNLMPAHPPEVKHHTSKEIILYRAVAVGGVAAGILGVWLR